MWKFSRRAPVVACVLLASWSSMANAACPGSTQMEMNQCAADAAKKADVALNTAYRKLSPDPNLVAAEKAWILFRDAQCYYEAEQYRGGSIRPLISAGCIERVTKARTAELTQLLKDESN